MLLININRKFKQGNLIDVLERAFPNSTVEGYYKSHILKAIKNKYFKRQSSWWDQGNLEM
jgi:hypothetical protein